MRWHSAGFVFIPLLLIACAVGWLHYRTTRFDHILSLAAARHGLDFHLVKSIIYEESWFREDIRGTSGELGLMQVSMGAASDYARIFGFPEPTEARLLEPELNVEIGSWYLKRSLDRYKDSPAPLVFALVRYNAGESRADSWLSAAKKSSKRGESDPEEWAVSVIEFPKTREYVRRILKRYRSQNYLY
jgi:soluble lytic murein transglycosylase